MKLFKLFLVVAIATLGLSSIASAKSLSEAIEGTDISGKITYAVSKTTKTGLESDDNSTEKAKRNLQQEAFHDIDFNIKLKIPTGDMTSVVAAIEEIKDVDSDGKTKKDSEAKTIQINSLYFQTKPTEKTTLSYGMMARHEGLKASHDLGMLTVESHYWFNTEDGVNDEISLGIKKLKAGPATINLAYEMSTDVDKNASQKAETKDLTTVGDDGLNNKDEGWSKLNFDVSAPVGPVAISLKYYSLTNKNSTGVNGKSIKAGTETALKVSYAAMGVKAHFIYVAIGKLGGISDIGVDNDGKKELAGGNAIQLKAAYTLPMGTPSLSYTVNTLGSDYKDKKVDDVKVNKDATNDTDIKVAFDKKFGKIASSFYYSTSTGFIKTEKSKETGISLSYKF